MADPGFPRRVGRQPRRGGVNLFFGQFFLKTAWKTFWARGGARPSLPLPDPPMVTFNLMCTVSSYSPQSYSSSFSVITHTSLLTKHYRLTSLTFILHSCTIILFCLYLFIFIKILRTLLVALFWISIGFKPTVNPRFACFVFSTRWIPLSYFWVRHLLTFWEASRATEGITRILFQRTVGFPDRKRCEFSESWFEWLNFDGFCLKMWSHLCL